MKIRFHRSRGHEFFLLDPRDGRRRGFFFHVGLGIEAPVDPLSGMTVNLRHVDVWFAEVLAGVRVADARSLPGLLAALRAEFLPRVRAQGAELARIELRTDRGWSALEGDIEEVCVETPGFAVDASGIAHASTRRWIAHRERRDAGDALDLAALVRDFSGRDWQGLEAMAAPLLPTGWRWLRIAELREGGALMRALTFE